MISYPPPKFDQQKKEVLQRYQILNGSEFFGKIRVAETVSLALGVPKVIAVVNERYRPWFRSSYGIDPSEMDLHQTFGATANLSDESFFIENVRQDSFFNGHGAGPIPSNIKFFAGAPLYDPEGKRLGTLCVIDDEPRTLSEKEMGILNGFASLVSDFICLRSAARYALHDLVDAEEDKCNLYEMATSDPLTRALNRRSFFHFTKREVARSIRHGHPMSVIMIDIDHFKQVNDVHGHASGDDVLYQIVKTISANVREEDFIGRLGGEEFALALPDTLIESATKLANRLRTQISKLSFCGDGGPFSVTISAGVSQPHRDDADITKSLARADKALYQAKMSGRNQVMVHTSDRAAA